MTIGGVNLEYRDWKSLKGILNLHGGSNSKTVLKVLGKTFDVSGPPFVFLPETNAIMFQEWIPPLDQALIVIEASTGKVHRFQLGRENFNPAIGTRAGLPPSEGRVIATKTAIELWQPTDSGWTGGRFNLVTDLTEAVPDHPPR